MPATAPQATAANVNRIAQVGYPVRAASACAPRTTRLPKMFIRPHAVFVSPDLERAIGLCKTGLRPSLRLTDLAQNLAHIAGGAQFAADIRSQAQIALGIEKPSLGVGRQFPQHFGEGAEDRLDVARFEPPFPGHAASGVAAGSSARPRQLIRTARADRLF